MTAYRRASAAVRVEGPPWAVDALSPATLATLGGDLATNGEFVVVIEGDGAGAVRLVSTRNPHIQGGPDPATWWYQVHLEGPTRTESRWAHRDEVTHVLWHAEPGRPWRAISPLRMSTRTHDVLAATEQALRDSADAPSTRFLEAEQALGEEAISSLQQSINAVRQRGRWLVVDEGMKASKFDSVIRADAGLVTLQSQLTSQVAAAFGIPPGLLGDRAGDGTSKREDFRRWYTATLQPLLRIVEAELRAKLHESITLGLRDLRALDMQGTSRAVAALANAGFTAEQAAAMVGLQESE